MRYKSRKQNAVNARLRIKDEGLRESSVKAA
jgi:hypothetical protein